MCAKLRTVLVAAGVLLLLASSSARAQESATAEEVILKTREAADYLAAKGEAGIDTFKTMKSQFVWRDDGYVFVVDCDHGKMLANPAIPRNNDRSLESI